MEFIQLLSSSSTIAAVWKPSCITYEFVVDKRHAGVPMAVDLEHRLDVTADRHVVWLQLEAVAHTGRQAGMRHRSTLRTPTHT